MQVAMDTNALYNFNKIKEHILIQVTKTKKHLYKISVEAVYDFC